jgi:hypothetical protein
MCCACSLALRHILWKPGAMYLQAGQSVLYQSTTTWRFAAS